MRTAIPIALLLCLLLGASCVAPAGAPPAASVPPSPPNAGALAEQPDKQSIGVTLPVTQPLASLVMLDAGVITTTRGVSETSPPEVVEMPVQGAFTVPVWTANGHHKAPLAVILPDAYRVCEANAAEEWPCPTGLQHNDYLGLRYLAQALALRGYHPLIVNLNPAYTSALDPSQQEQRAIRIVDHLLTWMADDMRQPAAEHYGGEMSMTTDYSKILLAGHGRGAQMALAIAAARGTSPDTTPAAPGLEPPAGLLLIAPALSERAVLPDLPTSIVLAGCESDTQPVQALVEHARHAGNRASLLATIALPGATRAGFNAMAAADQAACAAQHALTGGQQQAWLAAYAPDVADTATGYAPPYPGAGLNVLAPLPDTVYGLPVEATVTDPGRPGRPGEILPFNLGEIVVEQPVPPPADRMPLRVEGVFILPERDGPHPLVVLLHLRGSKCFSGETFEAVWPCGPAAIPRYDMGYGYLLQALASRGYAVAALNLVGAFTEAPAWASPDNPAGASSMDFYRVEPMVNRLMAALAAANRGDSLAFGLDLAGRLDLSQLMLLGHSRGGEWANLLALRRARNTANQQIAGGMGPVRSLFLLTPAHGDFTEKDPPSAMTADVPIAVVPAYCDGDLKEHSLLGQAYLEAALQDAARRAPAWVVALKTGEHYAYNTLIPFPDYNPSAIFCQDRDALLDGETARGFLAELAPNFFDMTLGRLPTEAIPGFDPAAALPEQLYGAPVEITALAQPAARLRVLAPAGDAELSTNLLGGTIRVTGQLALSVCQGTGDTMCVVDATIEPQPGASAEDWVYVQPKFSGYPPQVRVQWDKPDGQLVLGIPADRGDLTGYDALHFRVLTDMFDVRNASVDTQSFRVAMVDALGNAQAVTLPASEPALIKDRGERPDMWYWAHYPLRARSVRIPLAAFGRVDRSAVRSLVFIFDQLPKGSVLLSDVEFVSKAP